jgi:cytidylate kinase
MVVVVVSGMPVCGSSTTARLLAKKLGIRHFSVGDYYKQLAKKYSTGGEIKRNVEFFRSEKGSDIDLHHRLDEMQKKVAKEGNVIIDSKIGIKMLNNLANVKVWIKAPFDVRAKRVAKRDKIPLEKAKEFLKDKERLERENFKRIYGFDTFDQEKEADLVIDNSHLSPEEAVDKILKYLRNSDL